MDILLITVDVVAVEKFYKKNTILYLERFKKEIHLKFKVFYLKYVLYTSLL